MAQDLKYWEDKMEDWRGVNALLFKKAHKMVRKLKDEKRVKAEDEPVDVIEEPATMEVKKPKAKKKKKKKRSWR